MRLAWSSGRGRGGKEAEAFEMVKIAFWVREAMQEEFGHTQSMTRCF